MDPLDHDGDGRKGGSLPRRRPPEAASPDGRVRVVVTCDHIYLPVDAIGDVPADWLADMPTSRVGRRARLLMPADMAQSLSKQDRVEVL